MTAQRRTFPFIILSLCTMMPAFAAKKMVPTTVLVQKDRIDADMVTHVCPKGLRIDCKRQGYSIVANAPDWNIVFFSDRSKLKCTQSYDRFLKSGIALFSLPGIQGRAKEVYAHKFTPATYCGRQALRYQDFKKGHLDCDYIVSTDIPASPQAFAILQAAHRAVATNSGIPLYWSRWSRSQSFGMGLKYNNLRGIIIEVDTARVASEPFDEANLHCPAGYKEAPETKVLFDESSREDANMLLE